ncbi:hypothetical protein V501_08997 [Pseudogymnoascus sp. VKM F-4519 (FW-2642)]|nr:hypothetical protein V501_08997 [Pseudogymnoascus sp. VKM F-4519 (FW-2642)]OBT57561.1 hypothetical protein VE04_02913 [Pseudogymnoascus sp. 24MN13]
MNTVKSFWVGWGSLCVAGGAAYYFAKKSINADRQTRFQEAEAKRRRLASLEHPGYGQGGGSSQGGKGGGSSISPSQEASSDPAPTRHDPGSDSQRVVEKSKYEASQPYQTKKGDRFS